MTCDVLPEDGTEKVTRVCVFCEKWGSGGIEAFLMNVIPRLDGNRFEIRLVTAYLESEAYLPRLRELGTELTVLSNSLRGCHTRFSAFYRLLKRERFDAVHLNLYDGLALGYAAAAKRAGVPVRIVHSHNSDLRKSLLRPAKLTVHRICRKFFRNAPTHFAACSGKAAEFMFDRSVTRAGRWTLIRNGIDAERFRCDPAGRARMRTELGADGAFVIVCVGRLCFQKNQSFLLGLLTAIMAQCPKTLLVLAGEGEDRELLRGKAEELGVSDAVRFLGVTERIPELLWAGDVLAMPSVFEGLGIVAIEAQAAGLPAVCSEQVPRETQITDLISYLPLDEPARWAERLLSCRDIPRRDTFEEIRAAGYTIGDTAETIRRLWSRAEQQIR